MQRWIEEIEFLEKGREEATLQLLQKLMRKQHMTAEEALDFAEIFGEEREKYVKMLKENGCEETC